MNYRRVIGFLALLLLVDAVRADDLKAIAALERAGAIVKRDDSRRGRPIVSVTYNLRDITEDGNQALEEIDELPSLTLVGAGNTELSANTLRSLQRKPSLKELAIAFAKISDDSARILGTLNSLDVLDLRAQLEISPQGLHEIFKLTNLKELTLSDRLVSDEVLSELTRLSNLKLLNIRSVFVTDEGIRSVAKLKGLRALRVVFGSRITEEGLRQLADLRLERLEITMADVNNEKLKSLRKLSGLKSLRMISAAKVDDEAIPYLAELTELKDLDLSDAKLTTAGIKELTTMLPNCKVVHDARKRD